MTDRPLAGRTAMGSRPVPAPAPATTTRPAAAADLAAIHALLRDAALPTHGVDDGAMGEFMVAEALGRLVGVAGLEIHGHYGLLRSVAVEPSHNGGGIGGALAAGILDLARSRGLTAVYLLTTTASGFFGRRGFRVVERASVPAEIQATVEYSSLCPSEAIVMIHPITTGPAASEGADGTATREEAVTPVAPAGGCCGAAAVQIGGARHQAAAPTASEAEASDLKSSVRQRYGAAAVRAAAGAQSSCCGAADAEIWDPITSDLYDDAERRGLPAEAVLASLGCGNPTALARLSEGEVVLDLGSGGGIDVLLSARRVGPTGKAYGLDMTDEMLALARENQRRAGAVNVEFLKGDIESIPLPDDAVDVIISNCVINLAADKGRVLREAYRVLRPGGRFAVSDVVATRPMPVAIRSSMELWMGCIAGALEVREYERLLEEAGFSEISLEPTRVYGAGDARHFLEGAGIPVPERLDEFDGAFISAFVRATKPGQAGPGTARA